MSKSISKILTEASRQAKEIELFQKVTANRTPFKIEELVAMANNYKIEAMATNSYKFIDEDTGEERTVRQGIITLVDFPDKYIRSWRLYLPIKAIIDAVNKQKDFSLDELCEASTLYIIPIEDDKGSYVDFEIGE